MKLGNENIFAINMWFFNNIYVMEKMYLRHFTWHLYEVHDISVQLGTPPPHTVGLYTRCQ